MSILYTLVSRQYLISQIPIYITMFAVYYFIADLFTPNPRSHKIFRWLNLEMIEHIAIPVTFVFLLFILGAFALVPIIIMLVYTYGKILGNAETWNDWKKVLTMALLFFVVFMIPELIWILKFGYDVYYLYPLGVILTISTFIYLQFKFNLMRRFI